MKLEPPCRMRFTYPAEWRVRLASADSTEGQFFFSLAVGVGEVRARENGPTELVIDWSEVIWEPIAE